MFLSWVFQVSSLHLSKNIENKLIENDINMPLVDNFGKIAMALDMTNEEIGKEIRNIVTKKNSK